MSPQAITEKRQAYEDATYNKQIDCPEHPGQHMATLSCQGHRYAGIWDCPVTGDSDSHLHGNYETVTVESDGPRYQVYVCGGDNGCGVSIETADPASDAADAAADYQICEALGK